MKSASIKVGRNRSGIYFLKKNGVIIYIGKSSNVLSRMCGHSNKTFDEIRFIWHPILGLGRFERKMISRYKPKLNALMCEYRASKTYVCNQKTHDSLEMRRAKFGFRSIGRVLDMDYAGIMPAK